MRVKVAIAAVAVAAAGIAIWYFAEVPPLPRDTKRVPAFSPGAPSPAKRIVATPAEAPKDLVALAKWLNDVPLPQRTPFVREHLMRLSGAKAEDRKEIRAFLLSGVDVEIERPGNLHTSMNEDIISLRIYMLAKLEEFPPAEAAALAREILAFNPLFRESLFCLRALERHKPNENREVTLENMKRLLPKAAQPAAPGRPREQYVTEYDRIAAPIAHYRLSELTPQATEMLKANPFMIGRYTQALDALPPGSREPVYEAIFSDPRLAMELLGTSSTRSVDIWRDASFRRRASGFYGSKMSPQQQRSFVNLLATETGMHYEPKPMAEPAEPTLLQPVDPKDDLARAEGRRDMLKELEPESKTPELQEALAKSKERVEREINEIKEIAAAGPGRLKPAPLPFLSPDGPPASALDPIAGSTEPEPAAPPTPANPAPNL